MSKKKFPFANEPNTACITCSHIVEDKAQILYVAHDDDGWWQFLCGAPGHDQKTARIVSLQSILDIDPGIADVANLPSEKTAERTEKGEEWNISDYK